MGSFESVFLLLGNVSFFLRSSREADDLKSVLGSSDASDLLGVRAFDHAPHC